MAAGEVSSEEREGILEARSLYVSLGGMPVLRDVGLSVAEGEAVAIVGGNGSGKSTLVRALLGLIPHTEGSVRLFGTEQARFHDHSKIGYVPQHTQIGVTGATVRELVATGRLAHGGPFRWFDQEDKQAIKRALELVGLADRSGWPFSALSGGQKQRVLIARALATHPQLLVMDEPMAGVDLHSQSGLAELLQRLVDDGLALLVVLHELGAMATVLDRFVTLCDGRIVDNEPFTGAGQPDAVDGANSIGLEDPLPEVIR